MLRFKYHKPAARFETSWEHLMLATCCRLTTFITNLGNIAFDKNGIDTIGNKETDISHKIGYIDCLINCLICFFFVAKFNFF